jgi:hypothetical protein
MLYMASVILYHDIIEVIRHFLNLYITEGYPKF